VATLSSLSDALKNVLWNSDLGGREPIQLCLTCWPFAKSHLTSPISTEVEDLLVVDFEVRYTHNEFPISHSHDVSEDVIHRHLGQAIAASAITLHSESFARGGLPINKYRPIDAFTERAEDIATASLVDFASLHLWPKGMVELELLPGMMINNAILACSPSSASSIALPLNSL
jgi:hypothetical protein